MYGRHGVNERQLVKASCLVVEQHAHATGFEHRAALVDQRIGAALAQHDLPGNNGAVERSRRTELRIQGGCTGRYGVHAVDERSRCNRVRERGTGVGHAITKGGGTHAVAIVRTRRDRRQPRPRMRNTARCSGVARGGGDENAGICGKEERHFDRVEEIG